MKVKLITQVTITTTDEVEDMEGRDKAMYLKDKALGFPKFKRQSAKMMKEALHVDSVEITSFEIIELE